MTYQMNTALRCCGFDKVFDTNFTADLTIIEEGTELLLRLYKALVERRASVALPQFTSCSPGWVKYLEHFYPEYIPNLSIGQEPAADVRRADQDLLRRSCTASTRRTSSPSRSCPARPRSSSATGRRWRDSGYKDVDYGLTTRELAQMIQEAGIDLPDLPKSDFDDPFGTATGSGVIFGATGGVMEAALRTVIELVTRRARSRTSSTTPTSCPVRGFEGVRYVELTDPRGRPGAGHPQGTSCPTGTGSRARRSRSPWPRHRQRQAR